MFTDEKVGMKVICLEDKALFVLIEQVVEHLNVKKGQVENKWLTPSEAMVLLNVKRTSLQNLRDTGKIRYSQPQRKTILYDRESIMKYLEDNAQETF